MGVSELEDFKINVRLKLSALWTAVLFCYIYGDYFELYVPKKAESLLTGENLFDSPVKLFIVTVIMTIPSLMIFLSLMLKPTLTKWLNIGIGIFFTLFTLFVAISSLTEWYMFYVFLSLLESILTAIIFWQAWNWGKIN